MHKLRFFVRYFAIVATALGLAAGAAADTLDMSGASAGEDGSRPTRGMTQASVEAKYGSPAQKKAAVGDPPISRWVYPGFTVYFEYDRVIHAVATK